MWGKMSPHEVLAEHVVDIHKVMADFRDAFERHMASTDTFLLNHLCRGGSASTTGTLGLDVGGKTHLSNKFTEKWHIVTLQEASDYVDHDILQERFHVTHFAGCAILFNWDTFYPDISVKSFYTRRGLQDQIIYGEQRMGSARSSLTCLISSSRSQWSEVLYCVVSAYQQRLRQEERHRPEAHPNSSRHAMSQQRQPQHY